MLIGYSQGMPPLRIKDHRLMADHHLLWNDPKAERTNYATAYWPGGRDFVGDHNTDVGGLMGIMWAHTLKRDAQGAGSRLGFVGTTRDANGARLAGVTCSLFRTSDRVWIMDVLSDANGDFLLSTFDGAEHFIVFSKTGAPTVIGTTRQTLVGS